MSLNKLPVSTVTRLQSSQVISSIFSAVKELLENALDSGATSISVKLVNYGLDSIEVQDNGSGVPPSHVKFMCLRHYTSKISDFSDLGTKLETYGFRGEALSSLCNVASVNITTRTDSDEYASSYSFNNSGQVIDVSASHYGRGTTVVAQNIFSNFPVRKRYMSSSSKLKAEMKKIDNLVKDFAIINCKVCFSFCHDKNVKWQKYKCSSLKESISVVMGHLFGSQMEEIVTEQSKSHIILVLPKQGCNGIGSICLPERSAVKVFVNQRPVEYKKVEKLVVKCFHEYAKCNFLSGKCPFCVVSIKVPPNSVDVNTEPNKTKLLCHNEDELVTGLENLMQSYYGSGNDQKTLKETDLLTNRLNNNGNENGNKKSSSEAKPNFSSYNDRSDLESSDEAMVLWSRGHVVNPNTGTLLQGGATILNVKRCGQGKSAVGSVSTAKRLLDQEESLEDIHPSVNEPKKKCDNVGFVKSIPPPAALSKPKNTFSMSKSVESAESSVWNDTERSDAPNIIPQQHASFSKPNNCFLMSKSSESLVSSVSNNTERNDAPKIVPQQHASFSKPNNCFLMSKSNESLVSSVSNNTEHNDAPKMFPQQEGSFSKPNNFLLMSKSNEGKVSSVGNNSTRKSVPSFNSTTKSRSVTPKGNNIQNNTISEMFKKTEANPKEWKEGDVKKAIKWYIPPLNYSQEIKERIWNIRMSDCVWRMNVSDQMEDSLSSSEEILQLSSLPDGV